jgi:hypothetical protein
VSAGSALALFAAAVLAIVAVVLFAAAVRVRRMTVAPAEPDGGLVRDLTDEVRKTRAEAEHWRRSAARLLRELDHRS